MKVNKDCYEYIAGENSWLLNDSDKRFSIEEFIIKLEQEALEITRLTILNDETFNSISAIQNCGSLILSVISKMANLRELIIDTSLQGINFAPLLFHHLPPSLLSISCLAHSISSNDIPGFLNFLHKEKLQLTHLSFPKINSDANLIDIIEMLPSTIDTLILGYHKNLSNYKLPVSLKNCTYMVDIEQGNIEPNVLYKAVQLNKKLGNNCRAEVDLNTDEYLIISNEQHINIIIDIVRQFQNFNDFSLDNLIFNIDPTSDIYKDQSLLLTQLLAQANIHGFNITLDNVDDIPLTQDINISNIMTILSTSRTLKKMSLKIPHGKIYINSDFKLDLTNIQQIENFSISTHILNDETTKVITTIASAGSLQYLNLDLINSCPDQLIKYLSLALADRTGHRLDTLSLNAYNLIPHGEKFPEDNLWNTLHNVKNLKIIISGIRKKLISKEEEEFLLYILNADCSQANNSIEHVEVRHNDKNLSKSGGFFINYDKTSSALKLRDDFITLKNNNFSLENSLKLLGNYSKIDACLLQEVMPNLLPVIKDYFYTHFINLTICNNINNHQLGQLPSEINNSIVKLTYPDFNKFISYIENAHTSPVVTGENGWCTFL